MLAKSEVVTVCSWQVAGAARLQSTAMTVIMSGEPVLAVDRQGAGDLLHRHRDTRPICRIGRRKDAVIDRARLPYEAHTFELGLRDKLNNLAHIGS